MQIGTWDFGDFLLDPFTLRHEIINEFGDILESSAVLKIGHGISNDVRWLQRDFDIFMVNAIDTQVMYRNFRGVPNIGYADLVNNFYPELSCKYSKETFSDWRLRPDSGMTFEQEYYAVNDVHPLLRIFDQLRNLVYKNYLGINLVVAWNTFIEMLFLLVADETGGNYKSI